MSINLNSWKEFWKPEDHIVGYRGDEALMNGLGWVFVPILTTFSYALFDSEEYVTGSLVGLAAIFQLLAWVSASRNRAPHGGSGAMWSDIPRITKGPRY